MAGAVGVQPVVEQGGVVAGQHLVEAVDQGDSSLGGDPADGLVEGGDAVVGVALGAVRLQGGGCILASSQGSSPTSRTRSVWRRAMATSSARVAANRSGSWAARPVRRSKLVSLTPTATTTMVWSPSRPGAQLGFQPGQQPLGGVAGDAQVEHGMGREGGGGQVHPRSGRAEQVNDSSPVLNAYAMATAIPPSRGGPR